jgi:NAD(P)-dependent dehydrogenase (short-subunit alcohol dehydrogenase family)
VFGLRDRVAVVTGAAKGGLGGHVAQALALAGARVALVDLASQHAELGATLASLAGDGHVALEGDVTDEKQVAEVFDAAVAGLGPVDILVHAAGIMLRKAAVETTLEEWSRVLEVNLTGTWLTNTAAARRMFDRGGRIVNVSSVYTNIVGPLPEPAYYASKGGVAQLTRALAMEWSRRGINVNCIAPGVFYPTRMTEPLGETPEVLKAMEERTLLGRLGDPSRDLGGLVVFLASPASAYVTGQVIFVDGGWSAR